MVFKLEKLIQCSMSRQIRFVGSHDFGLDLNHSCIQVDVLMQKIPPSSSVPPEKFNFQKTFYSKSV
jgi:hypothetical protein